MIQRKTGLKPRTAPIRKVSLKQYKRLNKYRSVKKEFAKENTDCAICGKPIEQVHHGKGKLGDLLFDKRYMIPMCGSDDCHLWVEQNPSAAKALGLSYSRLNK